MERHLRFVASMIALLALQHPAGASPAIRVAGGEPAVLSRVEAAGAILAAAVSHDGSRVALAEADPQVEHGSIVVVFDERSDAPARLAVPGTVRALLFEPQSGELLGIRHTPRKKRAGDSDLVSLDPRAGKMRELMRLPSTARALEYWAAGGSLLIAGQNEIRTVRLSGLRSGPLFRLPGPNAAIASLGTSDRIVVAQDTELLLLDLRDPHGEESMPVRERTRASGPIAALAADPQGAAALARLRDGSVLRVSFEPLAVEPANGSADAVVALGKPYAGEPAPPPAPAQAAPAEVVPEVVAEADVHEAEPAPLPTPPPSPPLPARPAEAAAAAGAPQLWGRIDGPAREAVVEVVVLGPDNVLREALRVSPEPDGSWKARGLPPGRYQIQLAGGAQQVLVTEPRFVIVQVPAGASSVEAESFRVLRAYEP